ncbi:MAG: translation initiation factor IF-3, partial [Planctomycetota bacterium]
LDDAKDRAREAGLDLVEVSPGTPGADGRPPVCKIMDYGKWKYAQRKKEQKAKAHSKQSELKGMRLRPKIDGHDLGIKVSKARGFLEDGDKVQFTMLFRGREMAHQDLGIKIMRDVFEKLEDVAKVEAMPKMQGRRMTMLLTPDRTKKEVAKAAAQPAEATAN